MLIQNINIKEVACIRLFGRTSSFGRETVEHSRTCWDLDPRQTVVYGVIHESISVSFAPAWVCLWLTRLWERLFGGSRPRISASSAGLWGVVCVMACQAPKLWCCGWWWWAYWKCVRWLRTNLLIIRAKIDPYISRGMRKPSTRGV